MKCVVGRFGTDLLPFSYSSPHAHHLLYLPPYCLTTTGRGTKYIFARSVRVSTGVSSFFIIFKPRRNTHFLLLLLIRDRTLSMLSLAGVRSCRIDSSSSSNGLAANQKKIFFILLSHRTRCFSFPVSFLFATCTSICTSPVKERAGYVKRCAVTKTKGSARCLFPWELRRCSIFTLFENPLIEL